MTKIGSGGIYTSKFSIRVGRSRTRTPVAEIVAHALAFGRGIRAAPRHLEASVA